MKTKGLSGGPRYSKHYTSEPIRYPVLAITQLNKTEKENMMAAVKPLTTGPEAEQFVIHAIRANTSPLEAGRVEMTGHVAWSYRKDDDNRGGILAYRGIEVAQFFRRQVLDIEPGPGMPVPENVIKDPSDVWVRQDLLGPSARQANLFLKNRHDQLEEIHLLQQQQINAQRQQIGLLETEKTKLEGVLERRDKFIKQLKEKLEPTLKKKSRPKKRKR